MIVHFGCESLTSVTISNSVIIIGGWAFEDCYSLTSINIPNNIKNVDYEAFWHCKSLHEVTMNWNAQQLSSLEVYKDSSIFGDDGNIVNVYIPKGLIDQYKNVFTDSIIGNGVTVKWYDSIRKSNLGLIVGTGITSLPLIGMSCFNGYIYYKHYKNKKNQ